MADKPTRAKLQHYVPRFYLERFVDPSGFVWAYDVKTGVSRAAKPESVGAEANFYSPLHADGSRFDDVEKWLSKIESDAAPLFDLLCNGELLEGEGREAMALFLAAQYLRSPTVITALADLAGQFAHHHAMMFALDAKSHDQIFDEIDNKTGKSTSRDEREKLRQFLLEPGNLKLNVARQAGLPGVLGAERLAAIVYRLSWAVFDTDGQHLITSDSPVFKAYDPKSYHPAYGDGGFFNKTIYVTFPLSPSRMLELWWGDGDARGVLKIGKQRGKLYNRQRVLGATRSLFAKREDYGVRKLILRHADEPRPRIVTGGPQPTIEVKRKL